jgi:gliding motility-associated protein GldC
MKKSNIHIEVQLDDQNIPEVIQWSATDNPTQQGVAEVKAFTIGIWDGVEQGTLKIDLWNKQMEVPEMKRFVIETISGLADTIRRATSDELMAMDIENLCRSLSQRLEKELKKQSGS